jgi:hypothetical protein
MFTDFSKKAPRPDQTSAPRDRLFRVAKCLAIGLVVGPILAGLLLSLILQKEPALPPGSFPRADASHARQLIREHVQPGIGLRQEKRFVLSEEDLAAAANLLLTRKHLHGATRFRIDGERLNIDASLQLPERFPRRFLNLHLVADNGSPQATIKRLRIGQLSIPDPLIGWVVQAALHLPPLSRYGQLLENMVREVHIANERVTVSVNWNREMLSELRGLLTDVADKSRMLAYHDKLAKVLNDGTQNRYVRLGNLMQPLFALAYQRSGENHAPVEENRAAILVLSAYANGKDLAVALSTTNQPARRGVLLDKRVDTAKHFLGAAAMAMSGQGTLVEMIGLAKELHDTHDGSGFSFVDLAADEAGALFGKSAVRTPAIARRIQEILSQSAEETQFIPLLKDLPESMDAEEFTARFKAIGSPEYQAMKEEIYARIKALPLYRAL